MAVKPRTGQAFFLLTALAGVVLAVAGCSHVTPLGPDPVSLPPARDLGSPISMQIMRSQPPTPTGQCPAGSISLFGSEPNVLRASVVGPVTVRPAGQGSAAAPSPLPRPTTPPGPTAGVACYRPVGTAVTITSAGVSAVTTDRNHPGPASYGFVVAFPTANVPALTALIRRRIGMNSKGNALGQGNRANAAIGRALQLVIRNIGGGRPQEVDRATLGNPGKYTYCFAEDEEGSSWEPLSVERGVQPGRSAVTVFAGFGLQGVVDQKSRDPESLSRSFAGSLKAIHNIKAAPSCDALLVVCPEHHRTFKNAGWTKARLYEELYRLCEIRGDELVAGAKGIAEGGPPSLAGKSVNKFRPGGLMIVRAGGDAGMFSGIIGGWSAGGPRGSLPVTKEVRN